MNVLVKRDRFTQRSTGSEIYIDGVFECFGLEPPTLPLNAQVKPRAIPPGQYELTIRWSPRFGKQMPHIENVPGFSGIEIHIGNYPPDTHGCLIVGKVRATDSVGKSVVAFNDFMDKLALAGKASIVYETPEVTLNNV